MSSKCTKALEFKQYQKSNKSPFVIYDHLEFSIEKTDVYKNNPENYLILTQIFMKTI